MRLADNYLTLDSTALGPFKQIRLVPFFSNSGEDATVKDAYRCKEAAEFASVQYSLLAERLFKTNVPTPELVRIQIN
jgi:hypothetical protein